MGEEPIENEDSAAAAAADSTYQGTDSAVVPPPAAAVDDQEEEVEEDTSWDLPTDIANEAAPTGPMEPDAESSSLGLSDLEASVEALQIGGVIDGALLEKPGVPLDYNEQQQLATMIT